VRYVVQALSDTLISVGARSDVELALISLRILVWQRLFHAPKLGAQKYCVKGGGCLLHIPDIVHSIAAGR
jgi:hypothetical protein